MYKWPQGRVIRTICLVIVAAITADIFFSPGGAWGNLDAYFNPSSADQQPLKQLVMGLAFATLALSSLIAGIVAVGFQPKAVDFLIEVEQEMVKVEWPSSNVLVRSTLIIAVATAILAAMIVGVDWINYHFLKDWLPPLFNQALGA